VIRIHPRKFELNFAYLLTMLHGSFMSRGDTIVVPGGKMGLAMELVLTPIIHGVVKLARQLRSSAGVAG